MVDRIEEQKEQLSNAFVLVSLWVMLVLAIFSNPTAASSQGTLNDPPQGRHLPQEFPRPDLTAPQQFKLLQQDPRMNKECIMQRQPKTTTTTTVGVQIENEHGSDYVMNGSSNNNGRITRRQKREFGSPAPKGSSDNKEAISRRDWSIPQAAKAVNVPLASMRSMAVVNSSTMLCNGRSDICDLRYNQVTYPGTHNSATYQLQYDCTTATNTCLQTQTVCQQQSRNCTAGWETRCTKISNTCLDRLPSWLHWLCGAFSSVCESTEQFCLGWEEICTSSLEVCVLWGSACDVVVPAWAIECLWENQPDHTVAQQLKDGIRFLDLGTCLTKNNTQIVMCHGNGATRAIGVPLDTIMSDILTFMIANPYEVVTVEFNEYDGDLTLISKAIVAKVLQYFILPTGQSLMWPRSSLVQAWPTLREMILANQRLMIFMGDSYYPIPDPKPTWANQKDTWKQDGFSYTSQDSQPNELNASYHSWCDQGPPKDGSFIRWQQMDINLGIIPDDIIASLKKGQIPQLCIGPLAIQTNSAFLDALANYCYAKWPYWFRIRVNNYWEGDVFKMTDVFNDNNVARVKAGDTITPY
ncbi:hypothetical protein BGZ83_000532 [Gryganskiella cystojenkinii]|nr:hypothetical protein BGZ83_000532 [Gryganskiella cystojenkinii]